MNHVGAYSDEEVYTPMNSPVVKMDDEYIYFPSSANRDHDYRYDVDIPMAGGRYDSLCFFITTFDYTVTFLDKDGTVLDTQTVKYGESATAPVPPGMPHEDGYTYSCYWTGDSYENITSGPKDRTVQFEFFQKQKGSVTYIDKDGQEKTITDYAVLTETNLIDNYGYKLPKGTYLVEKDLNLSSEITLDGDVNLIIADGATLNVVTPSYSDTMTIFATDNYDLNIYGQKDGTGRINLETHGDRVLRVGFMKVYGCDITVNGEIYCISEFSIDRGSVTVNKNNNNIAGITVKGDMYVNGGKITVNGYSNIIGDPSYDGNNGIDAYNIYISGGEVVSLGNDAGLHPKKLFDQLYKYLREIAREIKKENLLQEFFMFMSVLSEATRISMEHREIFLAYLDLLSEQTEFLRPNMFNYNQLIVGITTEGDVLTVNDPFPNLDLPVYELSKSRKKGKEAVAVMEKSCRKYGYTYEDYEEIHATSGCYSNNIKE